MKIKREQTEKGWKITLEYKGTVYQAESKTLKKAMAQAFKLLDK